MKHFDVIMAVLIVAMTIIGGGKALADLNDGRIEVVVKQLVR